MDRATDNNTKVLKPGETARADYLHWAWQIKFEAAKNVAHHVDKMLHACGGSGYKRDMELERYVRDAKAGWVMGPTTRSCASSSARRCCSASTRSTTGIRPTIAAWSRTSSRSSTPPASASWPSNSQEKLRGRGEGAGQGLIVAAAARPACSSPACGRSTARWRFTGCAPAPPTAVRLQPDDRFTVINKDGGQVAEVTVLDTEGGEDAAAIAAKLDGEASVLRGLTRERRRGRLPRRVHAGGLIPAEARALRLWDDGTPRGEGVVRGPARVDRDRRAPGRPRRGRRLAGLAAADRDQAGCAALLRRGRAAGATGRAAPRLPRRHGDRGRLRGEGGRVHPDHRRARASSARTSSPSTTHKLQDGRECGLNATTTRSLLGAAYPQPGLYRKSFDLDQDPLVEVVQDHVGRHDSFGLCLHRPSTTRRRATRATSTDSETSTAQVHPLRRRPAQGLGGAQLLLQRLL